jgi:hypothetical protein
LIHYLVLWIDPTREAKVTKRREDEVREPIPAERDAACHGKEGIAGHFPSFVTVIHYSCFAQTRISSTLTVIAPVLD